MRHNNLCQKLGSIQQSQDARDLCYEPQMNEHNANNARALLADVRAVVLDGFLHITLTSQLLQRLCLVACRLEQHTSTLQRHPTVRREAKKTVKYRQTTAMHVNHSSFAPFVLETHGRLGKQTTDILRKLSRDRDAGDHHDRHEDVSATSNSSDGVRYFLFRFSEAPLKTWTPIISGWRRI
jgi:hypothetical protein